MATQTRIEHVHSNIECCINCGGESYNNDSIDCYKCDNAGLFVTDLDGDYIPVGDFLDGEGAWYDGEPTYEITQMTDLFTEGDYICGMPVRRFKKRWADNRHMGFSVDVEPVVRNGTQIATIEPEERSIGAENYVYIYKHPDGWIYGVTDEDTPGLWAIPLFRM